MTTWRQAAAWHDELRHFWRSDMGRSFGTHFFSKKATAANISTDGNVGADLQRAELAKIAGASLFWVSSDMLALAMHAARSMPDQTFLESDLPTPTGLIIFEDVALCRDTHDKLINIQAYAWHIIHAGIRGKAVAPDEADVKRTVLLTTYSNTRVHDDYHDTNLLDISPLGIFHMELMRFEKPIVGTLREQAYKENLEQPHLIEDALLFQRKLPLALWTLIQQPIAVVKEERVPREIRRRADKAKEPLLVDTLRAIDLRRAKVEATQVGDSTPQEWSHRWIVSGHWRNQWLPSVELHRLQWIHPYVKGPSDKPLVQKKTVHRLVR